MFQTTNQILSNNLIIRHNVMLVEPKRIEQKQKTYICNHQPPAFQRIQESWNGTKPPARLLPTVWCLLPRWLDPIHIGLKARAVGQGVP